MCCCISDEPIEDSKGRIKTYNGPNLFQTSMMDAPCKDGCNTFVWFCGQFLPWTCCCTQYFLRRKVLQGDMTKYSCCQGYVNCCCFKAGVLGEENCPDLCLCIESLLCNGMAVSASRMYVMDKYDLRSDPCDYRLIRINNCLQILACLCDILAMIDNSFAMLAQIIDRIADFFYHLVSGCMTAQVAHEVNYQDKNPMGVNQSGNAAYQPDSYAKPGGEYAPPGGQQVAYVQQQPAPQVVYVQQPPPQQVVYAQPGQQVVYVQQPPPQQVVYVQQQQQPHY